MLRQPQTAKMVYTALSTKVPSQEGAQDGEGWLGAGGVESEEEVQEDMVSKKGAGFAFKELKGQDRMIKKRNQWKMDSSSLKGISEILSVLKAVQQGGSSLWLEEFHQKVDVYLGRVTKQQR